MHYAIEGSVNQSPPQHRRAGQGQTAFQEKKKSKPSKTVISIHVTFDKSTNLFIFNDTLDAFNITFYFAVYSFIYFRFCQFQSPI